MDQEQRKRVFVLSVLLHILLFLLLDIAVDLKIIGSAVALQPLESNPIVFDLQQPAGPREVIETPEDARVVEPPKESRFLSDKNAKARNPNPENDLVKAEPFSKGDYESHDIISQPGSQGRPDPSQGESTQEKAAEKSEEKKITDPKDLYLNRDIRDLKEDKRFEEKPEARPGTPLPTVPGIRHDNRESQAPDMGGLSFNTYEWDFAPYMLALKNRIQQNIFPPLAFSQLGIIDGETLVRFRIYPNGELRGLEILGYKGHKTLMETSYHAVRISAPFPELPENFPEPYLEVTGKFVYLVTRGNR